MIYSINLHLFDLIGIVAAVFVLGMMAGHKYLPMPIDNKKEALIDKLFKENNHMRFELLHSRKFTGNDTAMKFELFKNRKTTNEG